MTTIALDQLEERLAHRLDQHYRSMAQLTGALGEAQRAQIGDVGRQVDGMRVEIAASLSTATSALEQATESNERAARAEADAAQAKLDAAQAVEVAASAITLATSNSQRIDRLPTLMVWTGGIGVIIGGALVSFGVWLF